MNYRYQFPGVDRNCTPPGDSRLGYSVGDRIPLDELNLDENAGICDAPAWDWNENTVFESGVIYSVNNDGSLFTLLDHNDWQYISFTGLSDADGAQRLAPQEIISCENAPPNAQ